MIKSITFAVIAIAALLLFIGCAQQPATTEPTVVVQPPSEDLPATGQESVDEVGAGISDISDAEEELDTSDLEDLDSVLADIESI